MLTGKYNDGFLQDSRLIDSRFEKHLEENGMLSRKNLEKVGKLANVAKELETGLPQLALAWVLKNENVSSVILGVSRVEQLEENLKALEVKEKLTDEVMKKIESII